MPRMTWNCCTLLATATLSLAIGCAKPTEPVTAPETHSEQDHSTTGGGMEVPMMDETPAEPTAPVEATPAEPTPAEPTPAEPTPAEPAPAAATPAPTPAEPAPAKPADATPEKPAEPAPATTPAEKTE